MGAAGDSAGEAIIKHTMKEKMKPPTMAPPARMKQVEFRLLAGFCPLFRQMAGLLMRAAFFKNKVLVEDIENCKQACFRVKIL